MSQQYFAKHLDFLRKKYLVLSRENLTIAFNKEFEMCKTKAQITSLLKRHKIKSGRTGLFIEGQTSWNKGTKGVCKGNSTSFKKGQKPYNQQPIGTERIDDDGYILVKTNKPSPYNNQPTRFRHKHLEEWEKANNREVPKGMLISFLDGNKLNCSPDNLELISKAENLYRNNHGYKNLPEEVKPSMRVLAKLETRRFSLEK